jgi:hypothetical protein
MGGHRAKLDRLPRRYCAPVILSAAAESPHRLPFARFSNHIPGYNAKEVSSIESSPTYNGPAESEMK